LADFHNRAETNPHIADAGRFAVVAQNARNNFAQSLRHVDVTVSPAVFERLLQLTEDWLSRLRPLIKRRARAGKPRDTHGDLRLEHVYLFPDQAPPGDLVIIDCIEFNESFRYADPVADMAFLVMDLAFHGRRPLARRFAQTYFQAAGDQEGEALLPFYTAYRAIVRAKVEGMENDEAEVPSEERARVRVRAQAHWLLALGELAEPMRKPALVLVGGLPGTGKSSLAQALAARAGFEVIRSDLVRKELTAGELPAAGFLEGRYAPLVTRRTYEECLRRAESLLFEGRRVVVDATFREDSQRRAFLDAARRWAVPTVFFVCQADPDLSRRRLAERRGDASDADWSVYLRLAEQWEPPGPGISPVDLPTHGNLEQVVEQALGVLADHALG
jgi:predicted kinase